MKESLAGNLGGLLKIPVVLIAAVLRLLSDGMLRVVGLEIK